MKKKAILQWTKEIVQLIFTIIIFLSIFIPNSLDSWLNSGFTN